MIDRTVLRLAVRRWMESRRYKPTLGEVSLLTTRCLDTIDGLAPGGSLLQKMEVADAVMELWWQKLSGTEKIESDLFQMHRSFAR